MKEILLLMLFLLPLAVAHARSVDVSADGGKVDSTGYVSVKPVPSPYVLLDKIAKQLKRDVKQPRSNSGFELKATFTGKTSPPVTACSRFRGKASIGVRWAPDTERFHWEDFTPLTDRDSARLRSYVYLLGCLSPVYAVRPNPDVSINRLLGAISPLQGYDAATKWFNLTADELTDTAGRRIYRLKYSRNSKPMFKELSRSQEPGYISGTAYFDAETLRLLFFKGMADLSSPDKDFKLNFSASYEEGADVTAIRQTKFEGNAGSVAIKGTMQRFDWPKSIGRCATEVTVMDPGTLSDVLPQAQRDTCTQLKVKGALNSADVRLLRQMGGCGDEAGKLGILDLSEVSFVDDKIPYLVLDARKERLAVTAQAYWTYEMVSGITSNHLGSKWNGESNRRHPVRVLAYRPMLYLGQDAIKPDKETSFADFDPKKAAKRYVESTANVGQYFFSEDIAPWEWKEMKRHKLIRFDGHELVREKDGYFLQVCTKKGLFPHDMFYKCSSLHTVVLPEDTHVDYRVKDKTSQTQYLEDGGYR